MDTKPELVKDHNIDMSRVKQTTALYEHETVEDALNHTIPFMGVCLPDIEKLDPEFIENWKQSYTYMIIGDDIFLFLTTDEEDLVEQLNAFYEASKGTYLFTFK